MKRCPMKLLLFLLAGALINVAVAWISALATARSMSSVLVTPPDPAAQWIAPVPGDWPDPVESGIERGFLSTLHTRSAVGKYQFVYQLGVPFRALQYELTTSGRPNTFWTGTIGRPDYLGVEYAHHLPCRPVVLGFAVNTIFYAAVLWVLCAVPFKVRQLRGGVASSAASVHHAGIRCAARRTSRSVLNAVKGRNTDEDQAPEPRYQTPTQHIVRARRSCSSRANASRRVRQ